jgi:hypothetical protein
VFETPQGQEIYLFSNTSRPAFRHTRPPTQCVCGVLHGVYKANLLFTFVTVDRTQRKRLCFSASNICNAIALYPKIYMCDIQISVLYYEGRRSNPCGRKEFSLIQTGSGAHPASSTMGTGSLFPGVKRPGRGVDHPLPSSAEVRMNLFTFTS